MPDDSARDGLRRLLIDGRRPSKSLELSAHRRVEPVPEAVGETSLTSPPRGVLVDAVPYAPHLRMQRGCPHHRRSHGHDHVPLQAVTGGHRHQPGVPMVRGHRDAALDDVVGALRATPIDHRDAVDLLASTAVALAAVSIEDDGDMLGEYAAATGEHV